MSFATEADLRAAARALVPELRARADEAEAARRLPEDLSKQLAAEGFYRMYAPVAYGGLETPPAIAMETVDPRDRRRRAGVGHLHRHHQHHRPVDPSGSDVPGDLRPSRNDDGRRLAPRGTATVVGGGFRVEGQWPWGSGTQNADWILAGCQVVRDGEVETHANGAPRSRMMAVPRSDVEFVDTWHVSGLAGTGSTDFAIRDRFVPESTPRGSGSTRPSTGRSTASPSSACSRWASPPSPSASGGPRSTS